MALLNGGVSQQFLAIHSCSQLLEAQITHRVPQCVFGGQSSHRHYSLPFLIALVCILVAAQAHAQIPQPSDTTSVPIPGAGHDYLEGLVDTVSPANGSFSIRIPVIMPPSRGVNLPFSFTYDSAFYYLLGNKGGNAKWSVISSQDSIYQPLASAGWSFGEPYVSGTEASWKEVDNILGTNVTCHYTFGYVFQDATGARHNLNLTNFYPDPNSDCQDNSSGGAPDGFEGDVITSSTPPRGLF